IPVTYESDELSTLVGLVVAGVGVALLPAGDPHLQLAGTVFVPLLTERTREVGLVWRADQDVRSTPGLLLATARHALAG
ncbi:MAG: LysR substrate-binding domain-containing protein, partial [Acidipropionibacterium jensenii]|uniref:LysR substrate-binding domain-containing protein n=1 Tax=Acidipropionibacterium jensenii TaxID=1749 RepID=UPI0026491A36